MVIFHKHTIHGYDIIIAVLFKIFNYAYYNHYSLLKYLIFPPFITKTATFQSHKYVKYSKNVKSEDVGYLLVLRQMSFQE